MQETREVFERLRRMDNFETQDFDATVRSLQQGPLLMVVHPSIGVKWLKVPKMAGE